MCVCVCVCVCVFVCVSVCLSASCLRSGGVKGRNRFAVLFSFFSPSLFRSAMLFCRSNTKMHCSHPPTHTHTRTYTHTHTHTHIHTLTFTRTQHTARTEATLVADNTVRIPQSDRAAAHMLRGAPTALRGSDADTAAALAPSWQPFESQLLDRHGDVRIADRDLQPGPLPNAVVLAPSPVDSFWLRGAELQALEPLRHFGQLFVQKSALGSGQRRRNSHRAQKQARLARNTNALSTARTRDTR